jgi:hypothetical protein
MQNKLSYYGMCLVSVCVLLWMHMSLSRAVNVCFNRYNLPSWSERNVVREEMLDVPLPYKTYTHALLLGEHC